VGKSATDENGKEQIIKCKTVSYNKEE